MVVVLSISKWAFKKGSPPRKFDGCSSPMPRNSSPDNHGGSGDQRKDTSDNSAVEEVDQFDGNKGVHQPEDEMDKVEFPKSNDNFPGDGPREVQEDEKAEKNRCDEKQLRKRKWTIINDKLVAVIETTLID